MRNPLSKRIPRNLKKNSAKYLGMILILVSTISVGSAFQVTLNGAIEYLENIVEDNLQEDGYFETAMPISEEMIAHFAEDGIQVYDNFYATERDFEDDAKVLLFQERTQVDIPTVFKGRLPEEAAEIAIDHVFARGRGIAVGDAITLLGKAYKVVGTVSMPDYSSLFMNNTDLMMNTKHFCVSVLSEEGFDAIEEKHFTYRYSYRFEDRNLKEAQKNTKAEEIAKYILMQGVQLQTILTRDQNQSISFLEMDIGTDGPFMKVFVYILVGMIAFIFAILTNNTIESESVIIGTLRALGYKKSEIIWHYLQPTFVIAVLGSVIGNVLGYTVMIEPFIGIYNTTYSIGPLQISFDWATFLLTTIVPVAIMVLINYWMLASKLSLSPLQFLRKELKKGKQKKTVKLPNYSFLNRFRLRVILQNRGSFIMLFCGVFLTSFLLMFGIGLQPLMDHYSSTIDESLSYNYQYLLKAPVEQEGAEKLFVYELDTWFSLGGKDIGVTCFGIEEDSQFFGDAYDKEGELQVSASSALVKKLGLRVGDSLELTDSGTEKTYTVTISKIYEYNAALSIFMDREALAKMLEKDTDSFNCYISNEKLDMDENYIVKVISRSDMLGAASQMLDSFSTVILFVNLFSVVVYMVVMYIMTKVVIDKNGLSISYMKVFGYKPGEIRKLYLTATTIVVAISLFICIPLEIVMFKLVLVYLSSMIEGYIEFYLPFYVYAEIIGIGFVSYFCINALHMRTLNKIPMTDALKSRE